MSRPKPVIYTLDSLLHANFPPRDDLLLYEDGTAVFKEGDIWQLYAKRGMGKSFMAMGLSLALATGTRFCCWHSPRPRKVLYIDAEMHADEIQQRANEMSERMGLGHVTNLAIFARTWQKGVKKIARLDTPEGASAVSPFISPSWTEHDEDIVQNMEPGSALRRWPGRVIVVDNAVKLFNPMGEEKASEWAAASEWLMSMRDQNISVLMISHAGKMEGSSRGHSAREDDISSSMGLKRPQGYKKRMGMKVVAYWDKTRGFHGDAAEDTLIWYDETGFHHQPIGPRRPKEMNELPKRILAYIERMPKSSPSHVAGMVIGKRQAIFQAIDELVETGKIVEEMGKLQVKK